jgi:hypothetical protein
MVSDSVGIFGEGLIGDAVVDADAYGLVDKV